MSMGNIKQSNLGNLGGIRDKGRCMVSIFWGRRPTPLNVHDVHKIYAQEERAGRGVV